jgi:hypothetical protein
MDVPGNASLQAALVETLSTIYATATPPVIHLAAAIFAPGPNLDPTTLTEATFTGYAALPITTFGVPHLLANGTIVAEATSAVNWTPTGTVITNTIYGWWMVDHTGKLLGSGLLPTPVLMDSLTSFLMLVPAIGIGPWLYTTPLLP